MPLSSSERFDIGTTDECRRRIPSQTTTSAIRATTQKTPAHAARGKHRHDSERTRDDDNDMALLMTFPAPRLVASRLLGARSLRTVGGRHHTAFGLHARASAADKQDTKVEFRVISGKSWLIVGDDAPVGRRRPLPLVRPPRRAPDASAVPAPPFFRDLRSYRIQGTVVARPISESAPERTDVLGTAHADIFPKLAGAAGSAGGGQADERTEAPREHPVPPARSSRAGHRAVQPRRVQPDEPLRLPRAAQRRDGNRPRR